MRKIRVQLGVVYQLSAVGDLLVVVLKAMRFRHACNPLLWE